MTSGSGADRSSYDVVIVGGGHNGLTAAAYLARAGVSTLLLERLPLTGGAAVSTMAFPGMGARLSRYSDLVSLMPEALLKDLELDVELRSRTTNSYTPYVRDGRAGGLLVERPEGEATRASFRELTGGDDEYAAWVKFYADVEELAGAIAPTLLEPLPTEAAVASRVDAGRVAGDRPRAARCGDRAPLPRRHRARRGRHRRADRHLRRRPRRRRWSRTAASSTT